MVATTKKAKTTKPQPKKPTATNGKKAVAASKAQPKKQQNAGEKRKRAKGQGLEYIPIPESVIKDDDDDVVSDEDLEFFAANKDFGKFLTSLDTKELSKNEKKIPQLKMERPKPKPEDFAISSSDEEDYYDSQDELKSDDEQDNDEVNSDVGALLESDDDNKKEELADESMEEEEDSEELEMEGDDDDEAFISSEEEEQEVQPIKKRKLKQNESDEEMDYEKIPRKAAKEWTQSEKSTRLPIKLPTGKIAHVESEEPQQQSSAEESEDEDEKVNEQVEAAAQSTDEDEEEEKEEKKLSKPQYILKKKEELAKIATSILEDPNENVGKLKAMRKIADDENLTVRKLALLSQLAVYRDIIPGYRIRQLTEKEQAVKVSKEVKQLREFEQGLLRNYELYLKDLDSALIKKKKASEEEKSLALVAAKCLCELLTTKTYFNFRLNIMVSVVACMSTVEWNELAEMCRKAIITVFEEDELGRVSLDGVIMITRMVKSKGYNVHENVINTFLHLRLKDELTPEASKGKNDNKDKVKKRKKDQPFLNKKARKALKETKEIEKEMKEAEAVVDKEEKEKHHTETLKLIFAFYFRILKKQATSPLLPAVLLGLGKFAHLINVGFFEDLLNALKDVMDNLDHKSQGITASSGTRKRLLCIVTAFELLAGQSDLIEYDLKSYYGELYGILFDAAFHYMLEDRPSPEMSSESEMILRGLELMFLKKRGVPVDRMAAFIKRFSLVALNMPHKTVITCLELMKRLINKDHRLDALTQSEDRAASGVYMPYLSDPDLCNPFGTSLYELFLYKDHYDPNVRALAQTIQQPPAV